MAKDVGNELVVRGRKRESAVASDAGFFASSMHTIETTTMVDLGDARATDVDDIAVSVEDDVLVELTLADGTALLTTVGQVREWNRNSPARSRRGTPVVTGRLPWARDRRGLLDLALKSLRLLRVDPVKELGGIAAAKAIATIESRCFANAKVEPGLYAVTAEGEMGDRTAVEASDKPALVLIHGTASYAQGAFKGLFDRADDTWKKLRDKYGARIFAFQHRTLSQSPAENAFDLAKDLPRKGVVHLITHSRGGIVGELLCRGAIDDSMLAAFGTAGRPAQERKTLKELGALLADKSLTVDRFVRVGCPAAGTTLASDRLDLYLSLLVNAFKLIPTGPFAPAVELATAVLVEATRRRASPEDMPGLEAQRPESPYTHFLNRADNRAVDHDLSIVAGDVQGGTFLQSLRAFASYAFYWERNDLVVNTSSMSGGLPRKGLVFRSHNEHPRLTHCNYFTEKMTRDKVLLALLREKRTDEPAGFEVFRGDEARASRSRRSSGVATVPIARAMRSTPATHIVLVVPDLFASTLSDKTGEVWPSAAAIAAGRLRSASPDTALTGDLHASDERLAALAAKMPGAEVRAVGYDWRLGIDDAAARVVAAFREIASAKVATRVDLVGHGLGALAAVAATLDKSARWQQLREAGSRCVLLAPPLEGTCMALRLLAGRGPWFQAIAMLDPSANAEGWKMWFASLRGVVDLLPDAALAGGTWKGSAATKPASDLLAAARSRRAAIVKELDVEGTLVLFGRTVQTNDARLVPGVGGTATLEETMSDDGDGWMVAPSLELTKASTLSIGATHEELLGAAESASTVARWLARGSSAESERRGTAADAGDERLARFPSDEDLDHRIRHGRWEAPPAPRSTLAVRVVHGSLDRVAMPIAVGHYQGDSIFGSEAFLDRCLDRRLSRRQRTGYGRYPGAPGTALFLSAPKTLPAGALIVGLGPVGELTAGVLSRGITSAAIDMAMEEIDRRRSDGIHLDGPIELPVGSLLIGTRGGQQLSVRQAIVAITNAILEANRVLARTRSGDTPEVRFTTLALVELWSDIAVAAAHVVRTLEQESGLVLRPDEAVEGAERIVTAEGARGNSRVSLDWAWWRRLIITEERDEHNQPRGLHFTALGERARAEDRTVATAGAAVDRMIAESIDGTSQVSSLAISNALYELLLPNAVKDRLYDGDDLVLVVDRGAGRYPWELLARAGAEDPEPLVRRVKLVRQLRTSTQRETVLMASGRQALVIANPKDVNPSLEGAKREGAAVAERLRAENFAMEVSIGEGASQVLQRFFRRDYAIMHIAAHGDYVAKKPTETGVVIADGVMLTAAMFQQLRATPELVFLNCCYLGTLDPAQPKLRSARLGQAERGPFAASVAEALIDIGVRCVVVAGWEVDDDAAELFANEFYGRFLKGVPFGDAVHGARGAVIDRFPDSTTWGAYQCYGDPSFRLSSSSGGATEEAPERPFVSADEAVDYVDDVTAGAASAGDDREELGRLRSRLLEIEAKLTAVPAWEHDGKLLAARADAWAAIGDGEANTRERAIELYRAALRADQRSAPIRSIEQLANLLDRRETGQSTSLAAKSVVEVKPHDALLAPLERRAQKEKRTLADGWLEVLDGLGHTPERHQLRAGLIKRRGRRLGDTKAGRALLRDAAEEYQRAAELRRANDSLAQIYYPLLQRLTLVWVAGATKDRERAIEAEELATTLEECRRSVRLEVETMGETFWAMAAKIEIDLMQELFTGEELYKASEFAQRFRGLLDDYGSPRDHESVLKNLEFLCDGAGSGASDKHASKATGKPAEAGAKNGRGTSDPSRRKAIELLQEIRRILSGAKSAAGS
ncbi:MAG: CHAT domain-containing protein [Phycisphaerae bacterium]|nr:CHAT domain-containing protein [Phycisphaerae bacterium]